MHRRAITPKPACLPPWFRQLTDAHIAALPIPRLQRNGLLFVWVRAQVGCCSQGQMLGAGYVLQDRCRDLSCRATLGAATPIQQHLLSGAAAAASRAAPHVCVMTPPLPLPRVCQVINAKYQFCLDLFDQWGYE